MSQIGVLLSLLLYFIFGGEVFSKNQNDLSQYQELSDYLDFDDIEIIKLNGNARGVFWDEDNKSILVNGSRVFLNGEIKPDINALFNLDGLITTSGILNNKDEYIYIGSIEQESSDVIIEPLPLDSQLDSKEKIMRYIDGLYKKSSGFYYVNNSSVFKIKNNWYEYDDYNYSAKYLIYPYFKDLYKKFPQKGPPLKGMTKVYNLSQFLEPYVNNIKKLRDAFTELYYSATVFEYSTYKIALKVGNNWYVSFSHAPEKGEDDQWLSHALTSEFIESHSKKGENTISEIKGEFKDTYYTTYDWSKDSNIITLEKFVRESSYSDLTAYLPQIPTFQTGKGYYSLNFKNTNIKLLSYTEKKIFGVNQYNAYWDIYYPPHEKDKSKSEILILEYRNPNETDKSGQYLIRSKNTERETKPFKLKYNKGTFSSYNQQDEIIEYENYVLKASFNKTLKNTALLSDFMDTSAEIAITSQHIEKYNYSMANYFTKLLINRINEVDYNNAKIVFYHYVDKILPYAKKHEKTSDFSGNALVLAILASDEKVANYIFDKLLGTNFDIPSLNNSILLYNLSCYYALNNQKEKLLLSVKQSIKKGVKVEQFRRDSDFKAYWNDVDFNVLLE